MGNHITVLGEIIFWGSEEHRPGFERNRDAILSMPVDDEWPPLRPEMFNLQMIEPSYQEVVDEFPTWFRTIPFGFAVKDFFDVFLLEWIPRFENLLRKMYWYDVNLIYRGMPSCEWHWTAAERNEAALIEQDCPPVTNWTVKSDPPMEGYARELRLTKYLKRFHFRKRTPAIEALTAQELALVAFKTNEQIQDSIFRSEPDEKLLKAAQKIAKKMKHVDEDELGLAILRLEEELAKLVAF